MEPRDIVIRPVLNGWCVRVGCTEVVFSDVVDLLVDLRAYLKNPTATEKRFVKESVNAALFRPERVEAAPPLRSPPHVAEFAQDAAMGAPADIPVWEQTADRITAIERDTDSRLDHLSQRLDGFDEHWHGLRTNQDQLSDRITELEGE